MSAAFRSILTELASIAAYLLAIAAEVDALGTSGVANMAGVRIVGPFRCGAAESFSARPLSLHLSLTQEKQSEGMASARCANSRSDPSSSTNSATGQVHYAAPSTLANQPRTSLTRPTLAPRSAAQLIAPPARPNSSRGLLAGRDKKTPSPFDQEAFSRPW